MNRTLEELRRLALRLPAQQRLALALELSEEVQPHPGLGKPEPGYEEWFRSGVEAALADRSRGTPHKQVVADIANVLRAGRKAQKLKASA